MNEDSYKKKSLSVFCFVLSFSITTIPYLVAWLLFLYHDVERLSTANAPLRQELYQYNAFLMCAVPVLTLLGVASCVWRYMEKGSLRQVWLPLLANLAGLSYWGYLTF